MNRISKPIIYLLIFVFGLQLQGWAQQKWDSIPRQPDYYKKRVEIFKKEKLPVGKVIFLGNSITEGGNWKKLTGDSTVINRGISGDITFGLLARLDEVTQRQPTKLFILIGINDLAKGIPDEVILQNIFQLVRQVQAKVPSTKIYVQSILPVNTSVEKFPSAYAQMDHVVTINYQLKKIAERFNYTYVDLFEQFRDAEGQLDKRFTYDGLHLNAQGYVHWRDILKSLKLI